MLGQYGGEVLQTTMSAAGLAALQEALYGGPPDGSRAGPQRRSRPSSRDRMTASPREETRSFR